jgi:D-beta-D-heptose 7-phosphate kinase/D-beta-D-heptose 1-phosphate adenosyltransferase
MLFLNNKLLSTNLPNIIVFGDIMLDYNIYGSIEKLANEAPIPVLYKTSEKNLLGGCGNVLMNLHSLGCNTIVLFSMIGNDYSGKKIKKILEESNIQYYLSETSITTVKNRFFCDNKILFRYDEECSPSENSEKNEDSIYQNFLHIIDTMKIDSIIFSDYNKGFLTPSLCQKIIKKANEKSIFTCVDPKNDYQKYKGCSLIKPNRNEVKKLFNIDCSIENIKDVLIKIKEKVETKNVVITLADKGIAFLDEKNNYFFNKTESIDVIDVTGAGDIVNTIISYYFSRTNLLVDKEHIIKLSSYIATKSVKYAGTYIVKHEDILLANRYLNDNKLITKEDIKYISAQIIFTNGCFDILHKGHLELFKFCKKDTDNSVLIVGLNSDASIKRLKGDSRPINNIDSRIAMLNSISIVDYIIVFDEDTPEELLKVVKPDILVKGGDYTYDTILGKEFCKEIKIFKTLEGYSTTNIILRSKQI